MEIMVRPVEKKDAEGISAALMVKSTADEVSRHLDADIAKMSNGEYLRCVALADGEVAGQAEFAIPESAIKKHLVEITGMVVVQKFQGTGVASKLYQFGAKWAGDMGIKKAVLTVRKGTKAEEIYRHWGFVPYGELPGGIVEPWGDLKQYDEVLMCKDL